LGWQEKETWAESKEIQGRLVAATLSGGGGDADRKKVGANLGTLVLGRKPQTQYLV